MVEMGYVKPNEGKVLSVVQHQPLTTSKLKDLNVKNYLFQSIDRTIFETILQKKTFKEILDSMRRKYQDPMRVKHAQLQVVRRELYITIEKCLIDFLLPPTPSTFSTYANIHIYI